MLTKLTIDTAMNHSMPLPKRPSHHHQQRGVSLIEVLVSLFVISVGLLGIAGLQTASIKESLDSAQRSQAMWLINEMVERMRANPEGQASGYGDTTLLTENCGDEPAKQCADLSSGNAAVDCTPNEMAAYDLWDVFCGTTSTDTDANIIGSASSSLSLESIEIECTSGAVCSRNDDFTISINWTSKAVVGSRLLSDDAIEDNKSKSMQMTVRL
jgi:type IV pilus assembly protein PilV